MPINSSRITSDDFTSLIKRVGKQSYIPKKIDNAVKKMGASRFYYQSASKSDVEKTLKSLQDQDLISKTRSAENLYRDTQRMKLAGQPVKKGYIGSQYIPERLENRLFVRYMGKIVPQHVGHIKTILGEYGLIGGRRHLTKDQMKRVLKKLQGDIPESLTNIGQKLKEYEANRKANIAYLVGQEISADDARYNAKNKEKLPTGVKRSVGIKAASSISRVQSEDPMHGDTRPSTSALRKRSDDSDDDKSISSASPYKKRTQSNTKKDPTDRPESLPDIFI